MTFLEENNNIVIEKIQDFDLEQTLECGQCFRFYKLDIEEYIIVAYGKMLRIKQDIDKLIFFDTTMEDFEHIWKNYFDLDNNYNDIKNELLRNDDKLKEAIETMYGVRILKQEFFETLISFIISQNKQIPHIMKIVETISERFGEEVGEYNGKKYYSFPSAERLIKVSENEFRECKTGFRAPYLVDAINKVYNKAVSFDMFENISNEEAEKLLITIKGVGAKVANCVMLFSLDRRDAFPVDVWIKRIMEKLYYEEDTSKEVIQKFANEHFGRYGGYAQQYLFYYARDKKSKKR